MLLIASILVVLKVLTFFFISFFFGLEILFWFVCLFFIVDVFWQYKKCFDEKNLQARRSLVKKDINAINYSYLACGIICTYIIALYSTTSAVICFLMFMYSSIVLISLKQLQKELIRGRG